MTAARNLEVAHHIDDNVAAVRNDVNQAKDGAKHPLTFFIPVLTFFSLRTVSGIDQLKRLFLIYAAIGDHQC